LGGTGKGVMRNPYLFNHPDQRELTGKKEEVDREGRGVGEREALRRRENRSALFLPETRDAQCQKKEKTMEAKDFHCEQKKEGWGGTPQKTPIETRSAGRDTGLVRKAHDKRKGGGDIVAQKKVHVHWRGEFPGTGKKRDDPLHGPAISKENR